MSRLFVPRALAMSSAVSVRTAARIGAGWAVLAARNGPPLLRLALEGSTARDGRELAQAAFRDELIGLARESAEISWREMRSGIDGLDMLTRTAHQPAGGPRARPYRVKP